MTDSLAKFKAAQKRIKFKHRYIVLTTNLHCVGIENNFNTQIVPLEEIIITECPPGRSDKSCLIYKFWKLITPKEKKIQTCAENHKARYYFNHPHRKYFYHIDADRCPTTAAKKFLSYTNTVRELCEVCKEKNKAKSK